MGVTFADQTGTGCRLSIHAPQTVEERLTLAEEIEDGVEEVTRPFVSKFAPSDMRQLALVAHNHMKPAMKEFITTYTEVLNKFRITGTQTTMRMCKTLWGEDNPKIEYGLTCTSGPLGGDAQVAALMCMEDLGALIFFTDPLSAHPHQADIDSLIRLANCGNVIMCINPTSAMSMMHVLKCALEKGSRGMIPSFFETLESPAVPEYKAQQQRALLAAVNSGAPAPAVDTSTADSDSSDDDDSSDEDDVLDVVEAVQTHQPSGTNVAPGIAAPQAPAPQAPRQVRRGSALAGIKLPEVKQKKKKKGAMHKIAKSMRKMVV